ncbi:aldo/keto reductase [Parachryseolinea silvisoli]|uniref:aldo/keto reductase n=1 Tax=Parachryseolinea silvisoli TaxID=2873601 RepID=UPI00226591ED|nr:aldo/keto reductase [Parachryseolinea silvisoli]MCD9019565.1 aldo/keto reductase [Parachryseolinea silvisoli]
MTERITRREALLGLASASLLLSSYTQKGMEKGMNTRPIPSSGEQLPLVGLGTWIQFDVGNDNAGRQPLTEVLNLMAQQGGKLIDTSPMYGRAEEVIGDLTAASPIREKLFYATKVWTTGEAAGIHQMDDSLRKMQRKTMDLVQVHNLTDWKTHLRTLQRRKAEGKVRYTGITHYTTSAHAQLEQILKTEAVDFVQFNYSLRVRNAERSLLQAAQEKGVAVIINEPFEKGSLFSLTKGKALPAWAADYDIQSWAQFFLKYILSHPAVTCAIPGTSSPKHVVDNMLAGHGTLPDEKGREKMVALIESL